MSMKLLISLASVACLASFAGAQNLLTNPGAEAGTLSGWTVGGTSNPGVDDGSFDGFTPHSGSFDFYGGNGVSGTLDQTVNLLTAGFTTTQIDSGSLSATFSFFEQSLNQGAPSDSAGVSINFLDGGGNVLGTATSGEFYNVDGTWLPVSNTAAVVAGTRSIDYQMFFVRHVGSDLDSFIDDNSLTVKVAPPVPEPSTLAALSGLGLVGLAARRRRRA